MKRKLILPGVIGICLFAGLLWFGSSRNRPAGMPVAAEKTAADKSSETVQTPAKNPPVAQNRTAAAAGAADSNRKLVAEARPQNASIRMFDESQVLEEQVIPRKDGSFIRRRLVRADGKYSRLVYEDTIRPDETGNYEIVSQTGMVADEVVVKLKEGVSQTDLETVAEQYGARVVRKLLVPRSYLLRLDIVKLGALERAILDISAEKQITDYAEPNYIISASRLPNDTLWGSQWDMRKISAPSAWETTTGSTNILVAVVDTGIDASHGDLEANMWINAGEDGTDSEGKDKRTNGFDDDGNGFEDDWQGWNFYSDNNNASDDNEHGTHVAGTIGAVGNNSMGVAGVCWNVSMVSVKFLGADGYGSSVDAADAILYANQIGAVIQNHSWAGSSDSGTLLNALEAANSNSVLVVAAAGNENNNNDSSPVYPAAYDLPNIVSVAATTESDSLAPFSNYGATSVDLAAPGVNILSTVPGDDYASFQGTSMAAPHVAGAAALLLSANPGLTCTDVKKALLNSTDKLSSLTGKVLSGGRLNVAALMSAAKDTDGDGMPDDWEDETGLNKNDETDALMDHDGDHLTNLDEYLNGTDPNDSDTDNDSLVDGWEVAYGFSPLSETGQLSSVIRNGVNTGGEARDVVASGNYAYVAAGESGLVVVDVSDPESPFRLSSCNTDGFAYDVAVSNGYAYVADGTNGLAVIDISNPAAPLQTGSYNTAGNSQGVVVSGNYVYIADGTNELVTINVSNPSQPQLVQDMVQTLRAMYDISIQGNYAYIAAERNVYKLDIRTPQSPSIVGARGFAENDILSVVSDGSYVYAAVDDGNITIITPEMGYVTSYSTEDVPKDVYIVGDYLYIAEGAGGLEIVDVSNISAPVQLSYYPTYGGGYGVFSLGDYIYLADGESGLQIFFMAFDSDADGMLDSWETSYFGNLLQSPTNDFDGDGIINWGEYLARLNPTNSDQDADGLIDGLDEVIVYNTDPRTSDTDADGLVDGRDGVVSTNDYPAGVDVNANGWVDGELDYNTDPLDPDTDDDGLPDGWEVVNGFNPTDDDSSLDSDGDGLDNGEEYIAETDPNNSDTDGDGMPDGWEVDNELDPLHDDSALDADNDDLTNLLEYTLGTDPQVSDSDGDGMPDGWEYTYMPPLSPTNSADGLLDFDGDGLMNRYEYSNNCNPTNSDTDADGMPDGWEVQNSLLPNSTNTIHGAFGDPDNDGLYNIYEYSLSSSNLWQSVYTSVTGAVMIFTYTDSASNTVEYIPGATNPRDADSDDDGLTDYYEITTNAAITNLYITNPNDRDTDDDGLSDQWERNHPLSNPTVPASPDEDSDGDGLKNGEEYSIGSQADNEFDPVFVDDDAPGDPVKTSSDDEGSTGNSDPYENGTWNPTNSLLSHPFDSIQEGIDAAEDGYTVLVNDGWYNGPGNIEIDLKGKPITVRSWHGKDVTTVSTLSLGRAFLFTSGETTNTVLQGFTLRGALCASSDGDCDWIEIVRIENSSPIIQDCTIQDTGGDAIQCSGTAYPRFINCLVQNARNGFWCDTGAAPVIVSNTIQHIHLYNTVFPMDEHWGNGIYAVQGVGMKIRSTTIDDCEGRGMHVRFATDLLMEDSAVSNSWGGIWFSGVDAELRRCKIQNNKAPNYYTVNDVITKHQGLLPGSATADYTHENENGGGILLTDECAVRMENVLLTANWTWAVDPNFPTKDELSLDTPELWGPDYGLGGGLYVGEGCVVTGVNCTVADNVSMTRGGGVSNHEKTYLYNIAAWGNDAEDMHVLEDGLTAYSVYSPEYYELHCRHSTLAVRDSDLWWPYYSDTNVYNLELIINVDPQFVGSGDYHLMAGSPCIDHGNSNYAPTNDLDGLERPLDGNNNGTNSYDMGAYEYYDSSLIDDADGDGLSDDEELNLGTNPNLADTDGDGMPDGWEVSNGLDPLTDDSGLDGDSDGLNNISEYTLGTDPANGSDPIFVDDDGPYDWFPGSTAIGDLDEDGSREHPFDAIQNAINVATNGMTVLVADGTYGEVGNYDLSTQGKAITVRSWNGSANTLIDTESNGTGFTLSNGETTNTVIQGFTVMSSTGGSANGVVLNGASPHITDLVISNFSSSAISCSGSSPLVIEDCEIRNTGTGITADDSALTFSNSWISGSGNGIHLSDSARFVMGNVQITNCTGTAVYVSGAGTVSIRDSMIASCGGHGLYVTGFSTSVDLQNVEIHGCAGNGIYMTGETDVSIQDCLISACQGNGVYTLSCLNEVIQNTTVSNCTGRGISIQDDPAAQLIDCTIVSNLGGIWFDGSGSLIDRCIIRDNNAPNYYETNSVSVVEAALFPLGNPDAEDVTNENENGAGICLVDGSSPLIRNCLIVGNRTWAEDPLYSDTNAVPYYGLGGGIYIGSGCCPTGVNCTVADNHANTYGGGLSSEGKPVMFNMIYWGNTASNAAIVSGVRTAVSNYPNIYRNGGTFIMGYSDVEDGYTEGTLWAISAGDPLFIGGGDYRLSSSTSPCIDAGVPLSYAPTNGLAGVSRPQDGNGDSTNRIDIGCYEYTVALPDPILHSSDVDGDGLADADEIMLGTNPYVADTDNDGFSDGDEFVVGTNPNDPTSFFNVNYSNAEVPGGGIYLVWDTVTGTYYTVQTVTGLQQIWSNIAGQVSRPGTGSPMTYTNNFTDTMRFYRIRAADQP